MQHLTRHWRTKVEMKVKRLLTKAGMLVILIGFLGLLWLLLRPVVPTIVESTTYPDTSIINDQTAAHLTLAVLGGWVYWSGIAEIFADRRDERSFTKLVFARPLRTMLWWFVSATAAITAGILVIAVGMIAMELRLFSLEWWQTLAWSGVLLVVLVALLDDAYSHLYFTSKDETERANDHTSRTPLHRFRGS